MTSKIVYHSLIKGLPSEEYHSTVGTYSSSQLKEILKDEESFYKKYISKETAREASTAFDVGTYFHTAVLEPHLISSEVAVFDGIKRGEKWDTFKAENEGKVILSKNDEQTGKRLAQAVKNSPVAMGRIERGEPEVSVFVELFVFDGQVVSTFNKPKVLGSDGWMSFKGKVPKTARKLTLKCRADLLGPGYILDLKSTSGNVKNEYEMASSVSKYGYDLSAAMYLDVFNIVNSEHLSEFIWTFASKDLFTCKSYSASYKNLLVGRAKWRKAAIKLAQGLDDDWQFEDAMGILEPQNFELEIIKPKDSDLL